MIDNEPTIIKTSTGFVQDYGPLSHRMVWDQYGAYLGQYQMNLMDDHPDAPPELFFRAQGNQAGEFGLTQEEMDNAVQDDELVS